MTPKPDARILPTQDEFDSWCQHPVSRFVAAAYAKAADRQKAAWEDYFNKPMIPADISALRLELKTREDAYRSILESTLADYLAILADTQRPYRPQAAQRRAKAG